MSRSTDSPKVAVRRDTEELAAEGTIKHPYSALRDPFVPSERYDSNLPIALYSVDWKDYEGSTIGIFDGHQPFELRVTREPFENTKLPAFELTSKVRAQFKKDNVARIFEKERQEKPSGKKPVSPRTPISTLDTEDREAESPVTALADTAPLRVSRTDADTKPPIDQAPLSNDFDVTEDESSLNQEYSTQKMEVLLDRWTDTEVDQEPTRFEDINITRVDSTKLRIYSQPLLGVIRSVVNYYPQQALTGDRVLIREPYSVLLHHYKQLAGLVSLDPLESIHLAELMKFLKPKYEAHVLTAEKMMSLPTPTITFGLLWYLFRPGEDVYVADYKRSDLNLNSMPPFCAVVFETYEDVLDRDWDNYDMPRMKGKAGEKCFEIGWWCLGSNGDEVGRWSGTTFIHHFDGERDIKSLGIYPSRIWDAGDGDARLRNCTNTGKYCYDILRAGSIEMVADGIVASQKGLVDPPGRSGLKFDQSGDLSKYKGRLIVDLVAATIYSTRINPGAPGFVTDLMPVRIDPGDWVSDDEVAKSRHTKESHKYHAYENIKVMATERLTDHQFKLLFPCLPGYALRVKQWMLFHLAGLKEVERVNKPLENVILWEEDLKIIKALSKQKQSAQHAWGADFVLGKGVGQIVLLHNISSQDRSRGPPGVGKTYTVECIAEQFARPLMVLTIADIGIDEAAVERQLDKNFVLAERWDAIVLIDEADVFLEQRKAADIARNGLVSAFLRKTEYFSGLLFLTTNRVGQVDDAFVSRVHVVIQYPELNESSRNKIWDGFFKKLERERRGKIIVGSSAKKYVKSHDDVKRMAWNGREIRNALQTAIALANFTESEGSPADVEEPVIVEEEHFRRVMEMSRDFKKYLFDIRKADEKNRAIARKDRAFELLSEFSLSDRT